MPEDSTEKQVGGSLQPGCCAAGVESEVCSSCEGYGSITYNPNLNPNAFPATASAKCTHCGGTGRIELRQPQHNTQAHPTAAGGEGWSAKRGIE